MKFNFKQIGKDGGNALIDIGAVTAGAIASNQVLDLQKIFPNQPADNFLIKHQGGVKAVASAAIIAGFGKKLPRWAQMLIIGVGVAGATKEVRVLMGEDKVSAIGADNNGSDPSILEDLLRDASNGRQLTMGANDAGAGVGSYDAGAGVGIFEPMNPLATPIPSMDYNTMVGFVR